MSDNNKKVIIVILAAILVGLGIFSYLDHNKQVAVSENLMQEKEAILVELTDLENKFTNAINDKTQLSKELEIQKNNIIGFKDSLKRIKNTNWKLIKFYKNKIKNLTVTTDRMMSINDSLAKRNRMLNIENQDLYEQKEVLSTNLKQQSTFNDTLVKQNLNLAQKVALGEIVQINNFAITTYDERRSGKFKLSDKARKVQVFKTEFIVNENPLAKEKEIVAHVVIQKPDGDVLDKKGEFLSVDNGTIAYSDTTVIPYKKRAISTDIITKTEEKLEKGIYKITIFINNKQVAVLNKTLD